MKRASLLLAAAALCAAWAFGLSAANVAPRKGKPCCAEDAAGAKSCSPASEKSVTLVGTVLCEHCDLHAASSCNPVFKADGREGYLAFCPETKDVAAIKAAGQGKAKLEVKGRLCKSKDGRELLEVESYSKKA